MPRTIRLLGALLLTMMCGCAGVPVETPVKRSLPHESIVVLPPVALPGRLQRGEDFRVRADRFEAAAKEANSRLVTSRGIYGRVRRTYSGT